MGCGSSVPVANVSTPEPEPERLAASQDDEISDFQPFVRPQVRQVSRQKRSQTSKPCVMRPLYLTARVWDFHGLFGLVNIFDLFF